MNDRDIALRAIALIDLTELGDTASAGDVRRLCGKAPGDGAVPPVAAVCVWPRHVALARGLLGGVKRRDGARMPVASVVNFPGGAMPREAVVVETRDAISDGADEIDLVLPYGAFLAGDTDAATGMVEAVRAQLLPGRRLKVILETGAYPDPASIRAAGDLAIAAGADFIKTSTGKITAGATPGAARAMLDAIRATPRPVGLKPSGGIRTLADARTYLALADEIMGADWASPASFRFGASGLRDVLAGIVAGQGREGPGKGY